MIRASIAHAVIAGLILSGAFGSCSNQADDPGTAPESTNESGRRTDGPLQKLPEGGYSHSLPVGAEMTDGFWVLRLKGDENAVIDDVRIEGATGLEQLGVKLAAPGRPIGTVQLTENWPPVDDEFLPQKFIVDAIGKEITPHPDGWELLIGMKVAGDGYLEREGVTVDYSVGDEEYTAYLPISVFICTNEEVEEKGRCPIPDDF